MCSLIVCTVHYQSILLCANKESLLLLRIYIKTTSGVMSYAGVYVCIVGLHALCNVYS